jgi:hypothetical protein
MVSILKALLSSPQKPKQNGAVVGLFLSFFRLPLLVIISPFLHTHLSLSLYMCNSLSQAAHNNVHNLQVGASYLILCWLQNEEDKLRRYFCLLAVLNISILQIR